MVLDFTPIPHTPHHAALFSGYSYTPKFLNSIANPNPISNGAWRNGFEAISARFYGSLLPMALISLRVVCLCQW
jgi:hypothetical protein